MKKLVAVAAVASGCMEYTPSSTLPPAGIANDRPLEVETQTDKLVQVQVPEVDILWVVDNSGSMNAEQQGIAANNPVFMDFFMGSGLDYHIAVVSTDMDAPAHSGNLRQVAGVRWVEESTPDPTNVFGSMIQLGILGSSNERGRDAAYGALEVLGDGANAGFERENAALHVIVLSDESDFSFGVSREEFASWLDAKKIDPDTVTFSSIVSPNPVCATASTPGDDYVWVTQQVGGIWWDICDTNWAAVLEQLGMQASGLKREYFLSQLPVPGTIEVWVKENGTRIDFEEEIDWTYEQTRNSILFETYVPNALSEVFVAYEILGASEG